MQTLALEGHRDMRGSTPYTLLTGATGLVGSLLTRDLLDQGTRLAVLVRSTPGVTATERVETTLQMWERRFGRPIRRPICLEGDVNLPDLGLSADSLRWLARHCHRVIHAAAVLRFVGANRQQEPWKTNLEGTRRTLALCRKLGVREFHYVSTAYVCGLRQGWIGEDELEMGQDFRNDYEHSKYLAERLVRDDDFISPATVYRPAVIAGDSQTGYTNTYHGLSVYMRLLSKLMSLTPRDRDGRRHAPLRLSVQGDEQRNVVPVDWVSQVIRHLVDQPAAQGQTFHLAPRIPLTARKFFEAVYGYFDAYGVEFRGTGWSPDQAATVFEKTLLRQGALYKDYELTDPQFCTANLERYAGHLPCPVIDETVLQRYLRYGQQDAWGRRVSPAIAGQTWVEDILKHPLSVTGGRPRTLAG
jgi:thioester reductase-like protein